MPPKKQNEEIQNDELLIDSYRFYWMAILCNFFNNTEHEHTPYKVCLLGYNSNDTIKDFRLYKNDLYEYLNSTDGKSVLFFCNYKNSRYVGIYVLKEFVKTQVRFDITCHDLSEKKMNTVLKNYVKDLLTDVFPRDSEIQFNFKDEKGKNLYKDQPGLEVVIFLVSQIVRYKSNDEYVDRVTNINRGFYLKEKTNVLKTVYKDILNKKILNRFLLSDTYRNPLHSKINFWTVLSLLLHLNKRIPYSVIFSFWNKETGVLATGIDMDLSNQDDPILLFIVSDIDEPMVAVYIDKKNNPGVCIYHTTGNVIMTGEMASAIATLIGSSAQFDMEQMYPDDYDTEIAIVAFFESYLNKEAIEFEKRRKFYSDLLNKNGITDSISLENDLKENKDILLNPENFLNDLLYYFYDETNKNESSNRTIKSPSPLKKLSSGRRKTPNKSIMNPLPVSNDLKIDLLKKPYVYLDLQHVLSLLVLEIKLLQDSYGQYRNKIAVSVLDWQHNYYHSDFEIPVIKDYIDRNIAVAIVVYYGYEHFSALYIPAKDNDDQHVKYCDPLGHKIPPQILTNIKEDLGLETDIEKVRLQNDHVSCGLFTVYALMIYIQSQRMDTVDIMALRGYYKEHFEAANLVDNNTFNDFYYKNIKSYMIAESEEVKNQREQDERNGIRHSYLSKSKPEKIVNPNQLYSSILSTYELFENIYYSREADDSGKFELLNSLYDSIDSEIQTLLAEYKKKGQEFPDRIKKIEEIRNDTLDKYTDIFAKQTQTSKNAKSSSDNVFHSALKQKKKRTILI